MCAQSCPTHCNPMDYSLPASSVYGIFQVRILEWVAISSSRGSFQSRNQTHVSSCICRQILYHCTTWQVCIYFISMSKFRTTAWKPMFQPSKERNYPQALVAQMVKSLSVRQKTWVWSLGQEDPEEGNGKPLQCPCLENSTDRGAWQVTQSMGSKTVRHNWTTNAFTFKCQNQK